MPHDLIKHSGTLSDWRLGEGPGAVEQLPPDQKAPWAFDLTITKHGVNITLTAPDLTARYVTLEIDANEAVVRGYVPDDIMDEPVSLRLLRDKVHVCLPSPQNVENVEIKR